MPEPRCELDHTSGYELLIATILSAQSTDKMVNTVTPELFKRWPGPAELASADPVEVEIVIKSTGFYRNKTRAIQGTARAIVTEFGGEVPRDMKSILTLPGVARKTANVVLGTAFRIPTGMAVDTHAGRMARRMGWTNEKKAAKVEKVLTRLFDKDDWIDMSHRLILHGRHVCTSKRPRCEACPLNELCPISEADPEGSWEERADRQRPLVESRGEVGFDPTV